MTGKTRYIIITVFISLIYYLSEIPLFKYLIQPGSESFSILIKFILAAAVVFTAAQFLLFSGLRKLAFKDINSIKNDIKKLDEFYFDFGRMPLLSLIKCILLLALYLTAIALFCIIYLSFSVPEIIAFSGVMLGYGLLLSGFIYVFLDRYVLEKLHSAELDYYPLEPRVNRQKSKMIIIPAFICIMSLCISVFAVINSLYSASAAEIGNELSILRLVIFKSFPVLFSYFLITAFLIITWAKNSAIQFQQIIGGLENMTTGEKDLSKRINISSVDELAVLSRYVNIFAELIGSHLEETLIVYNDLEKNQEVLNSSVSESSETVSKSTGLLDLTAENAERIDSIVKTSVKSGKELILNVDKTVELVENQSASISESSAAIEEMVASITEVSKRTDNVRENTGKLGVSVNNSTEVLENTIVSISDVSELSDNLMSINDMIAAIASQTNLLAMNAAIEAAHAGEAGRGFAVVADEIRKLAENTSVHLKSSSNSIKEITSKIQGSLESARETGEAFKSMKEIFGQIHDESQLIADSMTEHDRTNRQVLEQLTSTRDISVGLNNVAELLSKLGNRLLEDFTSLEKISESGLKTSGDIKTGNDHMKASISRLSAAAEKTAALYEKTRNMMSQFKLN